MHGGQAVSAGVTDRHGSDGNESNGGGTVFLASTVVSIVYEDLTRTGATVKTICLLYCIVDSAERQRRTASWLSRGWRHSCCWRGLVSVGIERETNAISFLAQSESRCHGAPGAHAVVCTIEGNNQIQGVYCRRGIYHVDLYRCKNARRDTTMLLRYQRVQALTEIVREISTHMHTHRSCDDRRFMHDPTVPHHRIYGAPRPRTNLSRC